MQVYDSISVDHLYEINLFLDLGNTGYTFFKIVNVHSAYKEIETNCRCKEQESVILSVF